MQHRQFLILLVCTANHCRSPMAEHLLRHTLAANGAGGNITVESAGTEAVDGVPMHSVASQILFDTGVEVDDWRSRSLTIDLVSSADLVLTAETRHRAEIVTRHPRSVQKTFPVLQFAELCELALSSGLTVKGPTDLIQTITSARGLMPLRAAGSDDIADPMGQTPSRFRSCAAQITRSMDSVARLLTSPI